MLSSKFELIRSSANLVHVCAAGISFDILASIRELILLIARHHPHGWDVSAANKLDTMQIQGQDISKIIKWTNTYLVVLNDTVNRRVANVDLVDSGA